jgi:sentrin-specific protease 1
LFVLELSEDALDLVQRVWGSGSESEVFADEFGIQVKRHDLNTLKGLNWLNDEVINFYLSLISRRSEQRKDLPKVCILIGIFNFCSF